MKKKIAIMIAEPLFNVFDIWWKKNRNMFIPCLQGIRMWRSTREEQKTDSSIQKIQQPENKFTSLL